MAQSDPGDGIWVRLFCVLAAIHVFVFTAAFPPFTGVDEPSHFDLAVKYSQGHVPRAMDRCCEESMDYITVFSTMEYMVVLPKGKQYPPPVWTAAQPIAQPIIAARRQLWNGPNHESSQPPLYYTLAGIWWHIGKWFGFHGGYLIYWLRFLNIFVAVGIVITGYHAARLVFPGERFIQLGTAALLAFFPQHAFYYINNDLLSALGFGLTFILLFLLGRTEVPGIGLGCATGLATAATFLIKNIDVPLVGVAFAFFIFKMVQLGRAKKFWPAMPGIIALEICLAVPIAAWIAWCKHWFGDFTGAGPKIAMLGWTHKPFSEWWSHPIFTPQGFWTFYSGLLDTFWQGEVWWHHQPMTSRAEGIILTLASTLMLAVAAWSLGRRGGALNENSRHVLWFGLASCVAVLLTLGYLSIIYDYHNCFYPSREHPYFTSGRLMLGALVPFILLFVYGLDQLLKRLGIGHVRSFLLAAMILAMLMTETRCDIRLFYSEYNWYHLQNVAWQKEAAPAGTNAVPAAAISTNRVSK